MNDELQVLRAKVQELEELGDALVELTGAQRQLIIDLRDFLNEECLGWDVGQPVAERVRLYAAGPLEVSDD